MKKEKAVVLEDELDLYESVLFIRCLLETTILDMNRQLAGKDSEIIKLRQDLTIAQTSLEANKQLFNKLLGDLARMNNDIEWYKKTYEQRSFLGTVREKLFRKH